MTASTPDLATRLGQLLIVGFRGARPEECATIRRDVHEHGVGGVVLFDQEMAQPELGKRNVESPEQLRELVEFLQGSAAQPLLVSIDQEGGVVNRLKRDYGFPASVSHEELGRRDDLDETRRSAAAMAETLTSLGINLNLAPVVDLDANPDNPIIKGKRRSFSADPEAVVRHASAFVEGHRERGVLTCLKHFPGHGSAAGDTHLGLVDVTETWDERELFPFQRLVEAGLCDMVMSAHVFHAGLDADRPATLSRAVITGILREKIGFDGVVASDDLEMKAIASHYGLETAVPEAIEAGIDVLCFGNNLSHDPDIAPRVIDILMRAVESGRIPESRIDESFERVVALKRRARLEI